MDNRLSYEEKKELPDDVFGLPERREYPMPDAAHVRAAEAYKGHHFPREVVRNRHQEPYSAWIRRPIGIESL